jgi:hypothetical protein
MRSEGKRRQGPQGPQGSQGRGGRDGFPHNGNRFWASRIVLFHGIRLKLAEFLVRVGLRRKGNAVNIRLCSRCRFGRTSVETT